MFGRILTSLQGKRRLVWGVEPRPLAALIQANDTVITIGCPPLFGYRGGSPDRRYGTVSPTFALALALVFTLVFASALILVTVLVTVSVSVLILVSITLNLPPPNAASPNSKRSHASTSSLAGAGAAGPEREGRSPPALEAGRDNRAGATASSPASLMYAGFGGDSKRRTLLEVDP
eukprot:CAMPEP_0198691354 /NCGR_PEP_ID=MMETSP1468-20131203/201567_1 /TAXON_ID=1461545 /ORGANISM="Mantoniella sp, Strain CCMP1436" /LENGTH=175 /DNA_ID=CAMNT_0044444479 /DNA_START=21 /DNA_END=546 /DNA_ORIENTATION=+